MKIFAGLGAVAILALGGCAMNERMARAPSNCGPGACQVEVTVVSCTDIKVNKEPVVVQPGYRGPMQWRLDVRSGWEFSGGGIVIHQGSDGEFDPAGNSAAVVTWNNNHRHADKTYKYDVVVMHSASGRVCRWDPSIMN